jgi:hypothetical protein
VPVLDDLDVRHQLASPLDDADADAQQGTREGQAEGQVLGTEVGDGLVGADRDVGDDEQHRADRGQREHRRDLALGTLLGLGVDVRRAPVVLGKTRVGVQVITHRQVVVHRLVVVAVDDGWGAHASTFFLVVRVVCAAIQIAAPTSRPMPSSQAARPSGTGPSPPRPKPP